MLKFVRAAAFAGATLLMAHGAYADTVIKSVMHSPLRLTDPHATTAYITTWHGYMIYDTLLATDADNKIQPQMLEKWDVSPDGKTYTMTLRDGQKWHDGKPVTADDCVASIKRWASGDIMGRTLLKFTDKIEIVDDKTFRVVMKEPTDLALRALSKPTGTAPFMMPKRIAEQAIGQPITDMTGSGPFKIVEFAGREDRLRQEHRLRAPQGTRQRFWPAARSSTSTRSNGTSCPTPDHRQRVARRRDRLRRAVPHDLLPMVEGNKDLKEESLSPVGYFTMYRFNFKYPPFNNKKIRQAAMYAVGQEDVMKALVGNPKYWRTCASLWGCGTPLETDIGKDVVVPQNTEKAKALLKEAGYDNTPVLIMHATDVGTLSAQPVVIAQALRKAGFNVNLMAMDWQSVATRRASKAAPAEGGWNIHNTNWYATDVMDPVRSAPAAASGDNAWFGWPDMPQVEELRTKFALTSDPAEQKKIADELQRIGIDEGLYVPLGQMSVPTVYSTKLRAWCMRRCSRSGT